MKQKTLQLTKSLGITIGMIAVCANLAFGQGNNWKITGNNNAQD